MAEHDRGEEGDGERLRQLLGVEHRGRHAHAAHREWQHANDPRRHPQPTALLPGLKPIRAQPGHIRPDGGPHAALSSHLLHRR